MMKDGKEGEWCWVMVMGDGEDMSEVVKVR